MWNQLFPNKKSQCEWLRRCLLVCIYGVSAPLLLSAAAHWGSSSCGTFGSAGFLQSCSTPSGGNKEGTLCFCKINQTGGNKCWLRELVCMRIGFVLCVVFCSRNDMCVCGVVVVGVACMLTWLSFVCLSHHTTMRVFPYVCAYLYVWDSVYDFKWQWKWRAIRSSEEVLCDNKGQITERGVGNKQMRAKQTLSSPIRLENRLSSPFCQIHFLLIGWQWVCISVWIWYQHLTHFSHQEMFGKGERDCPAISNLMHYYNRTCLIKIQCAQSTRHWYICSLYHTKHPFPVILGISIVKANWCWLRLCWPWWLILLPWQK